MNIGIPQELWLLGSNQVQKKGFLPAWYLLVQMVLDISTIELICTIIVCSFYILNVTSSMGSSRTGLKFKILQHFLLT